MNPFVQPLKPAYYADVEKQLRRLFYEILYAPILAIVKKATAQPAEVRNAPEDPLLLALKSGRVQYQAGTFSGEFNAAISKSLRRLGASWDARGRVYRLEEARVPAWVTTEATSYQMRAKGVHEEIQRALNAVQDDLQQIVEAHPVDASRGIEAINAGFVPAAQALQVSPQLTSESREALNEEYSDNMKLWIQKWCEEDVKALRVRVETNAQQGYRFDHLIAGIQNRYSVSENKARFLARQETGLFMAKFRERRFRDAGIRRYRWSTAHDGRVRHDHKSLDGQVFSYDDPPIVDKDTARRGNPGQDYQCRCVDIPVFEGQDR